MNGKLPRIQSRLYTKIKRFTTCHSTHFAILLKHREFLWL